MLGEWRLRVPTWNPAYFFVAPSGADMAPGAWPRVAVPAAGRIRRGLIRSGRNSRSCHPGACRRDPCLRLLLMIGWHARSRRKRPTSRSIENAPLAARWVPATSAGMTIEGVAAKASRASLQRSASFVSLRLDQPARGLVSSRLRVPTSWPSAPSARRTRPRGAWACVMRA